MAPQRIFLEYFTTAKQTNDYPDTCYRFIGEIGYTIKHGATDKPVYRVLLESTRAEAQLARFTTAHAYTATLEQLQDLQTRNLFYWANIYA